MEKACHRTLPLGLRNFLDTPVTEEELKAAVSKVAYIKAPGTESICLEFFKFNWDSMNSDMLALFNWMFWMVGSWNNRNMASSCAYLGTTFRPHQRNIEKLLC
jgi:hypothetical protein